MITTITYYIHIYITLLCVLNGQDEIRTHKMFYIRRLAIGYTSPVAACPCWLVYYLLDIKNLLFIIIYSFILL